MSWQDWVAVGLAAVAAVYLVRSLASGDDEGGGCDSCPTPPEVKSGKEGKIPHEHEREVH